jgi:hypothetical protein
MSNELQELEIELARLKLRREQLALEDDLQKRVNKAQAVGVGKAAVAVVRDVTRPKAGVVNWMVIVPTVLGAILLFTGSPYEQSIASSLLGIAAVVYAIRWYRSR